MGLPYDTARCAKTDASYHRRNQGAKDMTIKQFRKKPVVIYAVQWTGQNLKEVLEFTGKHPKWDDWFENWKTYEAYVKANGDVFKIKTLEGTMEATPGDWIIRGVSGEHYPCKPDIFAATYEPAALPAIKEPKI